MNSSGTLSITGKLIATDSGYTLIDGWNRIGCHYLTAEETNIIFNTPEIQVIKDSDDFWKSVNTLNCLKKIELAKAHYLKS